MLFYYVFHIHSRKCKASVLCLFVCLSHLISNISVVHLQQHSAQQQTWILCGYCYGGKPGCVEFFLTFNVVVACLHFVPNMTYNVFGGTLNLPQLNLPTFNSLCLWANMLVLRCARGSVGSDRCSCSEVLCTVVVAYL